MEAPLHPWPDSKLPFHAHLLLFLLNSDCKTPGPVYILQQSYKRFVWSSLHTSDENSLIVFIKLFVETWTSNLSALVDHIVNLDIRYPLLFCTSRPRLLIASSFLHKILLPTPSPQPYLTSYYSNLYLFTSFTSLHVFSILSDLIHPPFTLRRENSSSRQVTTVCHWQQTDRNLNIGTRI